MSLVNLHDGSARPKSPHTRPQALRLAVWAAAVALTLVVLLAPLGTSPLQDHLRISRNPNRVIAPQAPTAPMCRTVAQ